MLTSFQRVRLENEKRKVILQCNAKAYQSILQNPIAKKQKRISRTDQKTSQTCYRKPWCRQMWNKFEQLLKMSVQTDTKSTEKSIFQKPQYQSVCHLISFGILLQTFQWHWNTRKFQPKTWNTNGKNSFEAIMQPNSPRERNNKVLFPIFFIYVWTTIEEQVRDFYASQTLQHFSSLRRPETETAISMCLKGFLFIIRNTTIAVNGVEHRKTINI